MIIKNYEDVKAEPVSDRGAEKTTVRRVIAKEDGAKNFFMRVFAIAPGGCTPLHRHPWEHEVFILQGKGRVVKDGNEVSISEGHVLFIPPEEAHQFKNTSGTCCNSFASFLPNRPRSDPPFSELLSLCSRYFPVSVA